MPTSQITAIGQLEHRLKGNDLPPSLFGQSRLQFMVIKESNHFFQYEALISPIRNPVLLTA